MTMIEIVCRKGASVVCGPNNEANHVWGVMERHGLSHIAVVDDNRKFLGMVSLDEVLAHCGEQIPAESPVPASTVISDDRSGGVFGKNFPLGKMGK